MAHELSRRRVLSGIAGAAAAVPMAHMARAQTPKLDDVKIISAGGNLTPIYEALINEFGFFKKFGLNYNITYGSDASKFMGSLLTGENDLCPTAGITQMFPAVGKGARMKIVNGAVLLGQQAIFSGKPEIKTVKDLAGKTIGIGALGTQLHHTVVALMTKYGVDPNTVTWANVGSTADVLRAISTQRIDAGPAQIDVIPNMDKFGIHMVDGTEAWIHLADYPFQGGFASDAVIAQKRDLLVCSLAGYAAMWRFIASPNSKDAFRAARRKALTGSGEDFDAASDFQWEFFQKVQPFALDLIISPERIAYAQKVEAEGNQEILPYDKVTDMSLARDAIKLLG